MITGAAAIKPGMKPDLLITESTYATTIRDSKRARERDFLRFVFESRLLGMRLGAVLGSHWLGSGHRDSLRQIRVQSDSIASPALRLCVPLVNRNLATKTSDKSLPDLCKPSPLQESARLRGPRRESPDSRFRPGPGPRALHPPRLLLGAHGAYCKEGVSETRLLEKTQQLDA